jgi:hypothetical protein
MNDRSTNAVFNLAVDHVSRAAQPGSATVTSRRNQVFYSVTLLLIIVGALLVYKGTAALAVIDKVQIAGAFQARPNVVLFPAIQRRLMLLFAQLITSRLFGLPYSSAF